KKGSSSGTSAATSVSTSTSAWISTASAWISASVARLISALCVDLLKRVLHFQRRLRHVLQQLYFVRELNEERRVLVGPQNIVGERRAGGLLLIQHSELAQADVNQQTERERHIGFASEVADRLCAAIFFECEVVFA